MPLGPLLHEAIASVALSHDDDCDCIACRAHAGDLDAYAELAIEVSAELTNAELRHIQERS